MPRALELQSFLDVFDALEAPTVERTKRHSVNEIIFATLCGVTAGCDG